MSHNIAQLDLEQLDLTGCRITGAMTIAGNLGPKHHGVVLGRNIFDGLVYIAELVTTGYQIVSGDEFVERYEANGEIYIEPVQDRKRAIENARRALQEISLDARANYNLVTNNCETFANRALGVLPVSGQVVTTLGLVALVATTWVLVKRKK